MNPRFQWGRFIRHAGMLSPEQQQSIRSATIAIAGLGGIGGVLAMLCAKAGFGNLRICDRDEYEDENLVEQVFATNDSVGKRKVEVAASEIIRHNPNCTVFPLHINIQTGRDAAALVKGADLVVSAVDNPFAQILVSRAAENLKAPIVFPANLGWGVVCLLRQPGPRPYEARRLKLPKVNSKEGKIDLGDPTTREMIEIDWNLWMALISGFDQKSNLSILRGDNEYYPYMGPPAFFAASQAVSLLCLLATATDTPADLPRLFSFNLKHFRSYNFDRLERFHRELISIYVDRGNDEMIRHYSRLTESKDYWEQVLC